MGKGPLTRRLRLAVREYVSDAYLTHAELAARFGVTRSAITKRLARARAQGVPVEKPRRLRLHLAQLSVCESLAA